MEEAGRAGSYVFHASLAEQLRIFLEDRHAVRASTANIEPKTEYTAQAGWMKGSYNELRECYLSQLDVATAEKTPRFREGESTSRQDLEEIMMAIRARSAVFILSLGDAFDVLCGAIAQQIGSLFGPVQDDEASADSAAGSQQAVCVPVRMSTFSYSVSELAHRFKFQSSSKQFGKILEGLLIDLSDSKCAVVAVLDVDVVEKNIDKQVVKTLAYLQMDQRIVLCLLFHNEALFTRLVQRYRMVLPIHAASLCDLNQVGPQFEQHFYKISQTSAANASLPQLYYNILAHKSKTSAGYLVVQAILELQHEKLMSESNASLQNDVMAGYLHSMTAEQIKQRVRQILKHKRVILTGIDGLVQQEIARLNSEERSLAIKSNVRLIEICPNGSIFVPMKYSEIAQVLCHEEESKEQ